MTTPSQSQLRYQPALPIPNGKFALWLFLSTEIMFFTGLIGTYIVLRFGAPEGTWPSPQEVHVVEWIGAVNTFILLCSSATIVMAFENARQNLPAVAKKWLIATIAFGLLFLGIKGYEYASKFQHGIYPRYPRSLMYDRADLTFLDGIKMETSRLVNKALTEPRQAKSDEGTEVTNVAYGQSGDTKMSSAQQLQLVQAGLVRWTETVVGRTDDLVLQKLAIEGLAYQVYPQAFDESTGDEN